MGRKIVFLVGLILMLILPVATVGGWGWEEGQQYQRWGVELQQSESEEIAAIAQKIINLFQNTAPLQNPDQIRIRPDLNYFPHLDYIDLMAPPLRFSLELKMWFPNQGTLAPTAKVFVTINEPETLLGTPILFNDQGPIYLLPPVIAQQENRPLYARSAHPTGYKEAFPSYSFFPLWDENVEPFLRSIIRPSFALAESSVATVLKTDAEPLFIPITQKEWITALHDYASLEIELFIAGLIEMEAQDVTQAQIDNLKRNLQSLQQGFSTEQYLENYEQAVKMIENSIVSAEMMMNMITDEKMKENYQEMIEEQKYILLEMTEQLDEQLMAFEKAHQEVAEFGQKLLQALILYDEKMKEVIDIFKARDWDALEALGLADNELNFPFLVDTGRAIDALEQELNQLSLTEQKEAAFGFDIPPIHPLGPYQHVVALDYSSARPSGLVSPEKEGARALVRLNQDYFKDDAKSTQVQVLILKWWERTDALHYSPGATFYSEERVQMMENLWQNLDWSALEALLN